MLEKSLETIAPAGKTAPLRRAAAAQQAGLAQCRLTTFLRAVSPSSSRKSSEHGLEQDFNSLDAQREAAEAYIKSQAHEGWRPSRYPVLLRSRHCLLASLRL